MLEYRFRPIVQWPQKHTIGRRSTAFRSKSGKPMPLADTLEMLETELSALNGRNVILQVALQERDIRMDGRIRADARRPAHPGVILTFDSKYGPLSYPCDTFLDWESNLRAIAHHLNHVRMAQAYGVGKFGEAYKGFTALPGAVEPSDNGDPIRRAALHLLKTVEQRDPAELSYEPFQTTESAIKLMLTDADFRRQIINTALRVTHPDTGGSDAAFIAAKEAADLLRGAMK